MDFEGVFFVFWECAFGFNVWDVDGNCYVDLMVGFGVVVYGYVYFSLVFVIEV